MEPISRRRFFRQAGSVAAIAGAVAVVPAGVVSSVAGAATREPAAKEPELTASEHLAEGDNLIAHVKDARTGEISLFVGNREVLIHDRSVAARLVRATR